MIGYIGCANRAEIDGIVILDMIAAVSWHHHAMFFVIFRTPVKMIEAHGETAIAFRKHIKNFGSGRNDLFADPVTGDGRNTIVFHVHSLWSVC